MKTIKGIKSCVTDLKKESFGRIYMNVKTLNCFAIGYTDCNSYTVFESDKIIEVCKYNSRNDNLTMQYLKEKIVNSLLDSDFSYLIEK